MCTTPTLILAFSSGAIALTVVLDLGMRQYRSAALGAVASAALMGLALL